MNELKTRIRDIQDKFYLMKKDRERQIEKLNKLEKDREDTIHNIDVRVETINFIESVAAQERVSVKERVEKLITDCLHEVYDDSYSVEFDYGVKGNKTSVEINIVRKCNDGMLIKRGIDGIGGGVADTVSLPLKLIVLMNDSEFDKVLVTDEPGKHLDTVRIVKFAKFIQAISHQLGVQIIMSSHHAIMDDYADTIHKVTLNDSVSVIERLK
jgi:DNA repair exonuclease SbcCD ATPase subunit